MFYAIYVGFYQAIINERVAFEDEYCIKVNPLIIERKNIYIDSLKAMKFGKTEEYLLLNEKYNQVSLDYIDEVKRWLDEDSDYLNKWLMRLIVDKNTQDALKIQHDLFESEMISSILMIDMFEDAFENDGRRRDEINQKLITNSDDMTYLSEQLTVKQKQIFNESQRSIRNRLLRSPKSTCPAENYNIPDVDREIKKIFDDAESVPLPGIGA